MEIFVDSHAHLADAAFAGDRDAVIQRARAAGAAALVCIGASLEQARDSARVAAAHPGIVAFTAGIHPHDAAAFDAQRDCPELERILAAGAVAVGECGLDYHYDHSPRDRQLLAFEQQLALARQLALPAVVHTRDAENDTSALVSRAGRDGVRGVLHCFTGSISLARTALEAGWYISFSGIITFRNWTADDLIRFVPDDRLLVESDSPYLAPVPHRGRRNEPAWVVDTADRLAAVRGAAPDEIRRVTSRNADALFSLNAAKARHNR